MCYLSAIKRAILNEYRRFRMREYEVFANGQPSIVQHLKTYPEEYFNNLQHPLSIWNRSSQRVQSTMIEVLEMLLKAKQDKDEMKNVLPKYELLLHQYSTLINDDVNKIVGCFFGEDKAGKNIKQKAKMPSLQAHSSKIINALKHEQREMMLVNHFFNSQIIPGFRIVKNDGKATVLCEVIHYKPGDNVFGFYYELRYLFVGIFLLSEMLCKIIPLGPSINALSEEATEGRNKILDLFLNLPPLYLPNESKKEIPYVEVNMEGNSERFSIGLLDKPDITHKMFLEGMYQEANYTGDGITRNWAFYHVF